MAGDAWAGWALPRTWPLNIAAGTGTEHPNICQSRDPRAAEKRSSCRVRRSRKKPPSVKSRRLSKNPAWKLSSLAGRKRAHLSVPSELGPDPPLTLGEVTVAAG